MTKLESIIEMYPDESLLKADGFDDALLGAAELKPSGVIVLVYSKSLAIHILMKRDSMDYDEALEYYEFNVVGAYVGIKTPIWVEDEFFD